MRMNEQQMAALRNVLREIVRFTDRPDYTMGDLRPSFDELSRFANFDAYEDYYMENEQLEGKA